MPAFSRPYSRSSVTTPGQRIGRKAICDGCNKVKPNCLFVTREGRPYVECFCADCRSKPWAKGKIRHADAEFREVEL